MLIGRRVAKPWHFGMMRFDGDGRLVGVNEKPPAGQELGAVAVVGVYFFSPDIFQCIGKTPLGTDDQLERAYQMFIDQGQATHVEYDDLFDSYKFPWNLLTMSDLQLKQRIDGQHISPSAKISERAVIGDNVMIEDNMVEEGYRTGSNSVLMPGIKIGPNNVVGPGVTLLKSCYQTRLSCPRLLQSQG